MKLRIDTHWIIFALRNAMLLIALTILCCAHVSVAVAADDIVNTSIHLAPDRIVLNAQGNADNYHVVIPMSLPSGYQVGEYNVVLMIGEEVVAEAISFRYCDIDDNFLADFDRATVYTSEIIAECAGSTVEAMVVGCFFASSPTDTIEICFSGSDGLTVVAPRGQK